MLKKKCSRCERKIERSHKFCPFCGQNLNKYDKEDYGFLGKDDFDDSFESIFNNIPISRLFRTAMKMTEKMMKNMRESNQPKQHYNTNMDIQFFVNGKRVFPEKIQIQPKTQEQIKKITKTISKQKVEKFTKLPKKEPNSKVRRLSGKVIYELSMPGVKDINDVLINQLENSIEIKALSKTKVYSKTLNVNLPIIGYSLEKGNLVLELQAK